MNKLDHYGLPWRPLNNQIETRDGWLEIKFPKRWNYDEPTKNNPKMQDTVKFISKIGNNFYEIMGALQEAIDLLEKSAAINGNSEITEKVKALKAVHFTADYAA